MRVWLFAYLIWCVSTQLSYCLTGKSFHSKALAWTTRACLDKSKPNVGAPCLVFRIHSIYRAITAFVPECTCVTSILKAIGWVLCVAETPCSMRLTISLITVRPWQGTAHRQKRSRSSCATTPALVPLMRCLNLLEPL